jgi:hypothetical protein
MLSALAAAIPCRFGKQGKPRLKLVSQIRSATRFPVTKHRDCYAPECWPRRDVEHVGRNTPSCSAKSNIS